MKIQKALFAFVALASLLAPSLNAIAATYQVQQTYSGPFSQTATVVSGGNIQYLTTVNLTPVTLISGDSSLFSASLVTETNFLFDINTSQLSCAGICQFTETLKNGDTIFGNILSNGATGYEFAGNGIDIVKIWYTGEFEVTGGTGIFFGATGAGTYSGLDDYATMTQALWSTFTVTTVPEPENYALLLMGCGLILIASRVQQSKAKS